MSAMSLIAHWTWGIAMDRFATLIRSDLARFAWDVLGAGTGSFLAKRC